MLRLRNVQVDVPGHRYDDTVAFWAGALGATTRPGGGPYTHLVDLRATFGVHLQRLGSGPARYHLDLEADDVAAEASRLRDLGVHLDTICDDVTGEVERLLDLGAREVAQQPRWRVLADPAGDLLCVVDSSAPAA